MRKYKLKRSKRKTTGIVINKDGSLEVRAPLNLSKDRIDEVVQSKEKWIAKHAEEMLKKFQEKKEFSLGFGDYVIVRGEKAYIHPVKEDTSSYNEKKNVFYITEVATREEIKYIIIYFYKLIAKSYIPKRVSYFAKQMNVAPTAIRITSAKTRWGSCSGKNSVNFSWRLMMADDETIDYVIIHELAHIKQHNHSAKFWAIVESMMSNYKLQKEKLKELGEKLSRENWD